jgi:hypothetical protein
MRTNRKKQFPGNMRKSPNRPVRRGFALVVSLSLMILLTVIAVGLLTLSSISLRSTSQGEAMATARANARLALMLALGDLQKHTGPDTRVTARSDIRNEHGSNGRLTGVWDSWAIDANLPPDSSEYEKAARDRKFRGWLVSHPDPEAAALVETAAAAMPAPVTLWGRGSLGTGAQAGSVRAAVVGVQPQPGGLAWAVLDEGLKARVNTPYSGKATTPGARSAQLGTGECPGVAMIPGLEKLETSFFEQDSPSYASLRKGFTHGSYELAADALAPATRDALKPLLHDLSVCSTGLFTDTARGGLKQDLQLLTNGTKLPAAYDKRGIYASVLGMKASDVPSDPRWETLHEYARAYRDRITKAPVTGAPMARVTAPKGWQAATFNPNPPYTITANRTPPAGMVLMPTIAKVQMVFSLIGRDLYDYAPPARSPLPNKPTLNGFHGPQCNEFRDTRFDFDLHLMYTPVVTLHNPYNVALEFNTLRVEFVHTPMAVQVFRNGKALSQGLIPVDTMYADNDTGKVSSGQGRGKIFGMNLKDKDKNGRPAGSVIRLLPGEVKVFSPFMDPNRNYRNEFKEGRLTWDYLVGTGLTQDIDAIPGWRGDGMGYSCDWLAGGLPSASSNVEGHWRSCYGLAGDDNIHVEFAPLGNPRLSNNKFIVRMTAVLPGASTTLCVNAIEIDYERPTGLQETLLGKGKTLRFPETGTVKGIDLVDHASTPIKNLKKLKPFAVLSVQGKTTSGARDSTLEDGRFATKPWLFGHPVIGCSSYKFATEHPTSASHELDIQRLEVGTGTSNLVQVDPQDRGNFISGLTPFNGLKFGSLYEVPVAPVQTMAAFNGANPGGCSGYLPRFAQPIGNSWSHPQLPPSTILLKRGREAPYLDHSFLLNLALYDRFYFSGFGERSTPFLTPGGKPTTELAKNFAETGQPLDDVRLLPFAPDGRKPTELADIVTKEDAYTKAAAWQMMMGSFNINSTSVQAWKAMLASIRDSEPILNSIDRLNNTSKLADLPAAGTREARISRFRLPASPSAADGGSPQESYWLGPREYSDAELEKLASAIVDQVRERGPFLSMAEFVNRQIGTGDLARSGALQTAIDRSGVNLALAGSANAGFEIAEDVLAENRYADTASGAGPSYQGAPGFLTQADVLNVLGNAATPRSDTFTIRGYGEARDKNQRVIATATCEAVVQRFANWIDPADKAETAPASLTSPSNRAFGRRYEIVSFRWLNQNEI